MCTTFPRYCNVARGVRDPMQQSHDSILRRLGKLLRDQDDDITHEPLPNRWVDLIHFLDEKERKPDEGRLAENKSRDRLEH